MNESLTESILPQEDPADGARDVAWPTHGEARQQLLAWAKSDIIEHRIGSELNVKRCFRVSDEELASELAARLALTARQKLQLFSMQIPKVGDGSR